MSPFKFRSCYFVFVICFVTLGVGENISAQSKIRSLTYAFQRGDRLVYITVDDSLTGPMGMVASTDPRKKEDLLDLKHTERLFTMSRARFDQMWSAITSASVRKYAVRPRPWKLELPYSYVFYVARAQDAEGTLYIVPKNRASRAVTSAAKQLFGYAK